MATDETTENLYQQGRQRHQEGDLEAARALYRQVLAAESDHAQALHSLANIDAREGRFEIAETALRKALQIDPRGVGFNNSLGNVLIAQQKIGEAQAAYERELSMRPDFAISHHQLGRLHLAQQNPAAALKCFEAAIQFAPTFAEAACNLGTVLGMTGRHKEAAEAFRHALRLAPRMADAHAGLGDAMRSQDNDAAAEKHYSDALEIDDSNAPAFRGLGLLHLAHGRASDAMRAFRAALVTHPNDAESHKNLGHIYHDRGLMNSAIEHYRKAIDASPGDAGAYRVLAAALNGSGDADAAIDAYQTALRLQPSHQGALAGLAVLQGAHGDAKTAIARLSPIVEAGRATSELVGAYAKLLGTSRRRTEGIALLEKTLQKTLPRSDAKRLHFILADLLDSHGTYDLAFYHYRKANNLSKAVFDAAAFARHTDHVMTVFSAAAYAERTGSDDQRPVFVLGPPRAGTSVVNAILREHPSVHSTGAAPYLEFASQRLCAQDGGWPAGAANLLPQTLERAADEIVQKLAGSRPDADRLVSANWRNYLYAGMIRRLFPNARIVECVRDYRDVALDCYFHRFLGARSLPFAYNLGHIAAYLNNYRRLMKHWRQVIDVPVFQLSYESLAHQPKDTCAELLEFLELTWEPACVGGFTSSGASVLYARSLRRYRNYKQHLDSFLEMLDAPPDIHEYQAP